VHPYEWQTFPNICSEYPLRALLKCELKDVFATAVLIYLCLDIISFCSHLQLVNIAYVPATHACESEFHSLFEIA